MRERAVGLLDEEAEPGVRVEEKRGGGGFHVAQDFAPPVFARVVRRTPELRAADSGPQTGRVDGPVPLPVPGPFPVPPPGARAPANGTRHPKQNGPVYGSALSAPTK